MLFLFCHGTKGTDQRKSQKIGHPSDSLLYDKNGILSLDQHCSSANFETEICIGIKHHLQVPHSEAYIALKFMEYNFQMEYLAN